MIYHVVISSGIEQSDSVIHVHTCILFRILFSCRLYASANPKPPVHAPPPPTHTPVSLGKNKFFKVCESVSVLQTDTVSVSLSNHLIHLYFYLNCSDWNVETHVKYLCISVGMAYNGVRNLDVSYLVYLPFRHQLVKCMVQKGMPSDLHFNREQV